MGEGGGAYCIPRISLEYPRPITYLVIIGEDVGNTIPRHLDTSELDTSVRSLTHCFED